MTKDIREAVELIAKYREQVESNNARKQELLRLIEELDRNSAIRIETARLTALLLAKLTLEKIGEYATNHVDPMTDHDAQILQSHKELFRKIVSIIEEVS